MVNTGSGSTVWIVIPARGGSVGIPRKNLKTLAGKPLLQYAVEAGCDAVPPNQVVLITDTSEIATFGSLFGIRVILELEASGPYETLDEKIFRNVPKLRSFGCGDDDIVLTIQPTSPLVSARTIRGAIERLEDGCASAITVAEERHLIWERETDGIGFKPLYSERKNRQEMNPKYRETGAVIGSRLSTIEALQSRVVAPVGLVIVSDSEAVDIDEFGDFFQASHLMTRSTVVIRVDAGIVLGMGHVYRALAVANELSRHNVIFAVHPESVLALELIGKSPYAVHQVGSTADFADLLEVLKPAAVIFDILDTDSGMIHRVRKAAPEATLVTFEDEGTGAKECDVGIYDLTSPPLKGPKLCFSGPAYAVLGPSFELYGPLASQLEKERNVLVSFGGTDPAGLTRKVIDALVLLDYQGKVTVVSGPGAVNHNFQSYDLDIVHHRSVENMAMLIGVHEVGIISRGRTVFEFSSMGVPAICFAQNEKEAKHIHVGRETGTVAGGQGYLMSEKEIAENIKRFLADRSLQKRLTETSKTFRTERRNSSILLAALDSSSAVSLSF